ncbi:methylated-DNA--[protein]-cysteine S-methyltransferase [Xylophilus sp. Leaf220]|uniref:methylated-DNA--[protein]-cysteine S-methyltransferase n=1 Tax=Xylophilus sp. Leaf220 TaxID=1735686 RepID=UPI0007023AAF|nr:methylated-DNA--[protein]-cysteine S-methyltransferase [Xylophilus sp. Leaf220]KQM75346.1 cysteine methyltransferase [Xylophilus sp. Leaf220]
MIYPPDTVLRRWTSPLGAIDLAATPRGLAGLWFFDQRHRPPQLDAPGTWPLHERAHAVLDRAVAELSAYFAGSGAGFAIPLDLPGATDFQQAVWRALVALPLGTTTSYGALAVAVGRPAAVRAVGAAVGRNPVSIVVPCHRVVGSAGLLTGYAGGLERKAALLALERGKAAGTGIQASPSAPRAASLFGTPA